MNVAGTFLSLSRSLDFSHQGLMRHHRRTALIAAKLGQSFGLKGDELGQLIQAALIHDIGVLSWQEKLSLTRLDIDFPWEHCQRGMTLLRKNPSLSSLAPIIFSHHDRWSGCNPSGLEGDQIPLGSRIIHLADRMEILTPDSGHILDQKENILKLLQRLEGRVFDPQLVACLRELARCDAFWLDLTSPWEAYLLEIMFPYQSAPMEVGYLRDIASLFSRVVDAKSPFTYRHSRGVASLARFLAKEIGVPADQADLVEIAGLLHDLGKLSVPAEILEKPDKLTASEFNVMKQHAYYTYGLLKPVTDVFPLAEWAAFHHERPDGSGYPFGKTTAELSREARIITMADVFVALREERPYRPSMGWKQIEPLLMDMADKNEVSREMAGVILDQRSVLDRVWEELS